MSPASGARPAPRAGLLDIAPYTPGKASAPFSGRAYKLSSNETPLGPSPAARAAYLAAAERLEDYPDGSASVLRAAIGQTYGLDPDRIVCGAGSDELLNLIAHAYIGPGDEGLFTEHGFLVYRIAIKAAGGTPVVAPERDLTADVDALLAAVTPRTKVVFLANPNNPTGTYLPASELRRLQAGLPPHVLLVVDAAYADYVRRNDYEAGIELVATCDNVVMTRTFSKIHGLASLRLGWLYGPAHVVDALNRIRGPFNVGGPAIKAGAASIADHAFVETARRHNEQWLAFLAENLARIGIEVTPSVGNFLLLHFTPEPGRDAQAADAFLLARGLILRRLEAYGLPHALRLTVGGEDANRAVIAALEDFMGSPHD